MIIPEHYYAVIFTEISSGDDEGYSAMAARMRALAEKQPGYVGFENYVSTDNQMTGQKNRRNQGDGCLRLKGAATRKPSCNVHNEAIVGEPAGIH